MAPAPINGQNPTTQQRRVLRYSVEAPLDVTVLRWGIPDTVPGRSLNLGAGGLAAVLAGELSPGDKVGVEIRLPELEKPLRTRALVRHHDKLRCGMEFIGLSAEQQAEIQRWAAKAKPEPVRAAVKKPAEAKTAEKGDSEKSSPPPPPPSKLRGNGWIFLALSAVILLAVLWWRWNRGWDELESALQRDNSMPQAQVQVPAEAMEKLVRHRVDPDYPAAARPQKLQGVIVLDVIVGSDGSVAGVRALGGPPVLAQAAVDALRWWRFEPYRVDGNPVVAETTVAVEFKP
jgi:TonB family protein